MKKVYKYEFPFENYFEIDLPIGAEILTCNKVDGKWFLWALVIPDSPTQLRSFRLSGTGHNIEDENSRLQYKYITTQFEVIGDHTLIWHIFEIIDKKGKK